MRLLLAVRLDFRCRTWSRHDSLCGVRGGGGALPGLHRSPLKTQLGLEGTELDKAVFEHYEPHRVAVYHVLQHAAIANSETIHRYLVSRPVVSPLFLDGRGTRGFWAVDEATGKVVFLKDTWRFGGLEGLTLAYMNEEGVRNVPVLADHGDVPDFIPESERVFERE